MQTKSPIAKARVSVSYETEIAPLDKYTKEAPHTAPKEPCVRMMVDYVEKSGPKLKVYQKEEAWQRWQSRKTLSSPPPTGTSKLQLFTEQLSMRMT